MAKAKKAFKEPKLNQPEKEQLPNQNLLKPIRVAEAPQNKQKGGQKNTRSNEEQSILSLIGDTTNKIKTKEIPNIKAAQQSKSKPEEIDLRSLITPSKKHLVLAPVDVGAAVYDEIKITSTIGPQEEKITYSVDLFEKDNEPVISSSYYVSKSSKENIEVEVNFGWNWITKNSNLPLEEIENKVKSAIVSILVKNKFNKEKAGSIANKIIVAMRKQGGLKKIFADFIKKSTNISF